MTRILLLLILAVTTGATFGANSASAESVLTQISGKVEIGRGEPPEWAAAQPGDVVSATDRVRTGADGRVEIQMDAGTLRVHENSMLRLPRAVGDADQVELDAGRSLFDVLRRDGRRFEVHTPTVVVSVKGTRFHVDAGADVGEVAVYRGTVGVREVGADAMMETLVREGFVATGGIGIPVEIDVSVETDPWQRWQSFGRAVRLERKTPERMRELDRAKATLHRATAADVIIQAAERKPEVARRLEKIQEKQRDEAKRRAESEGSSKGRKSDDDAATRSAMPAAPDFGDRASGDQKRQMLGERLDSKARSMRIEEMRRRALEVRQVIDSDRAKDGLKFEESARFEDLSGGGSFSGGGLNLDYAALYEMSPEALLSVKSTLTDLQVEVQAGTFVPTSIDDLTAELERALIADGFSSADATKAVATLLGQ